MDVFYSVEFCEEVGCCEAVMVAGDEDYFFVFFEEGSDDAFCVSFVA